MTLHDLFQLSNAPIVIVWGLILLSTLWSIGKLWNMYQNGKFERRLLRPDGEGRYPVILVKNDKDESIIFFDRELGWSKVEFESKKGYDDGMVE